MLSRFRRTAIALVAASSFSMASTATAVARPLEAPGLPAPTPLVLQPSGSAPTAAPQAVAIAPIDVPIRVPARTKATLGKFVLVLLAIVGIAVVVALAVVAYAIYDIRTNNE